MVIKNISLVLIAIWVFGTGAAFAQVTPPSGMIGWWAGDGDGRDASGNGNDAIPAGGMNSPTYSVGEVGQTFTLNGGLFNSLQFASIPDSAAIRPQSVTVEAWGKLTSVDNAAPTFFGKALGTGNADSYVTWYQNGTFHGAVCNNTGCAQLDAPSFSLNVWHHIALTYDDPGGAATKTLALYVDGIAVASGTSTGAIGYDTHPALIGGDFDFGSIKYGWTGGIDEISLYNRALSLAEIQAIRNAGINGKNKQAVTNAGLASQSVVNDATITFEDVTTAGTTTDYTIDPTTVGTLPPGYTQTGLAYDISTTAVYSGLVTECFYIPSITDPTVFSKLKVLHSESGILADKTSSYRFSTSVVCARTTSLSPFVIANGLVPTAANVAVDGRVTTADGRGIRSVRVTLTDHSGNVRTALTGPFGYYRLDDVEAGQTVVISVTVKHYVFAKPTRILTVQDELAEIDFIAEP
ncbi:MAG: LamG-like jellyroll fold domain-containing protein [Acidobacteriota bacterium]